MTARMVRMGFCWVVLSMGLTNSLGAGVYNTADTLVETQQMSHDYERVFRGVLVDLRTIALKAPERKPPIWKRYVLMETLGRQGGAAGLASLEQKLDFSAVLIRRGRAAEAVQLLDPLTRAHADNFVVWSQFATASFLSDNEHFIANAPDLMKHAMSLWPEAWDQLEPNQKTFLESIGWEVTAFDRNRKYEAALERLIRHRVREAARRKRQAKAPPKGDGKNEKIEETLDPIFVDDNKVPVKFLTETDEFAAGRIAEPEYRKLPEISVEIVEQLLLWMPHDQRLLWLLGETLNARAMKHRDKKDKDALIRSAYSVFTELSNPLSTAPYGTAQIKHRFEVLDAYVRTIRQDPGGFQLPDDNTPPPDVTNQQWQRNLAVGFVTGFAVGMFALWQFQEIRRRRQARG